MMKKRIMMRMKVRRIRPKVRIRKTMMTGIRIRITLDQDII